jgi:hypothetical protein
MQVSPSRSNIHSRLTNEEVELFIACIKNNRATVDEGKHAKWARKMKEETFRADQGYAHISVEKLKNQLRDMKRT